MKRQLDPELVKLNEQTILLGARAEKILERALDALRRADLMVACAAIQDDDAIDKLSIEIEEHCIDYLALRRPVAHDLRLVKSIFGISRNLEQIGNSAASTAGVAVHRAGLPGRGLPPSISAFAGFTVGLLTEALDAFTWCDAKSAERLLARDAAAEEFYRKALVEAVSQRQPEPDALESCIEWVMVARNLEKVTDLAINIVEEIVFITQAQVVRRR